MSGLNAEPIPGYSVGLTVVFSNDILLIVGLRHSPLQSDDPFVHLCHLNM